MNAIRPFRSKIEPLSITFYHYPKADPDQDIDIGEFEVVWESDIRLESWGISSISPHILSISGHYNVLTPTDGADKEEEHELDTNTPEFSDWGIEYEMDSRTYQEHHQLFPQEVEFDWETKKILVNY